MDFDEINQLTTGGKIPSGASYTSPIERPTPIQTTKVEQSSPQPSFNPLHKHFRKPGVSISLPSKYYWYKGSVELSATGEVDIYPMTASDEIMLKNPDALMNGRALENLLTSCVPQIKNVRSIVSPDLDALFVAIRLASAGDQMDLDVTCPKCQYQQTMAVSLHTILDNITTMSPPYHVTLDTNLVAFLKPFSFEDQIKATTVAFNETRSIMLIEKAEKEGNEEARRTLSERALKNMTELKFDIIVSNIEQIDADGQAVTDKQFIKEFLQNADKKYVNLIDKAMEKINNVGIPKEYPMICSKEDCKHEWNAGIEFNPASFFA
jgi:hypothetical protein